MIVSATAYKEGKCCNLVALTFFSHGIEHLTRRMYCVDFVLVAYNIHNVPKTITGEWRA
jgi:hypothetical protein